MHIELLAQRGHKHTLSHEQIPKQFDPHDCAGKAVQVCDTMGLNMAAKLSMFPIKTLDGFAATLVSHAELYPVLRGEIAILVHTGSNVNPLSKALPSHDSCASPMKTNTLETDSLPATGEVNKVAADCNPYQ